MIFSLDVSTFRKNKVGDEQDFFVNEIGQRNHQPYAILTIVVKSVLRGVKDTFKCDFLIFALNRISNIHG